MLGFDKRAARSTWTAALVLLLLYVVYLARKTLSFSRWLYCLPMCLRHW